MMIENKITQFLKHRILLHVGFWTITLTFALLGEVNSEKSTMNWFELMHLSVHFVGFIAATYLNLYLLIPRLLINKKHIQYFFYVFLTAIISTLLTQQLQIFINKDIFHIELNEDLVFLFFHISFYCGFIMMLTTLFYFLRRRMSMQEMGLKLREVEKQQVMSELKALKSQINPHFFFNTLNSIYALSLENNPKTPDVILKLSELMRYVLYESSGEKIALERELNFVKNYVELEKSRFEDSVKVLVDIAGKDLSGIEIAPLLFIPFIENAFKHTVRTSVAHPEIKISFQIKHPSIIVMVVENTKEKTDKNNATPGGLGLENVKQRLELIYPEKHVLKIDDEKKWYRVLLEIDLSLN